MKIKRYVVKEMQEAIRLIKQDLGPEAVIVSSYKVPSKGLVGLFTPRLLEVTAALDHAPEIELRVVSPPAQLAAGAAPAAERQLGPARGPVRALLAGGDNARSSGLYLPGDPWEKGPAGPVPMFQEERIAADRAALPDGGNDEQPEREARRLFEMMVKKEIEAGQPDDPALVWRNQLLDMDIQEKIVGQLISGISNEQYPPGQLGQYLFLNLISQVRRFLEPAYKSVSQARIKAFIGPPGAGKTTTLAKLAARASLYEHKKVALISVYTYRIGATDQLEAYGDFMGIPVEVVMTPAELARVIESHSDKDYIFIDTNGRSPRKAGQVLELKGFLNAVPEPRDIYLVMDSAVKNRDLVRSACEYQKAGYSELIFTKVDETETLGSILNLVAALGLPAAYLTNGQGVPDDIIEADPRKVAQLIFRGVDPDELLAARNGSDLPAGIN